MSSQEDMQELLKSMAAKQQAVVHCMEKLTGEKNVPIHAGLDNMLAHAASLPAPATPPTNFSITFLNPDLNEKFITNPKRIVADMPPTPSEVRGERRNLFRDVAEFDEYIFRDKCRGLVNHLDATAGAWTKDESRYNYTFDLFNPQATEIVENGRLLNNLYISGDKLMKKYRGGGSACVGFTTSN